MQRMIPAAILVALAVTVPAEAHVTLQPKEAPAGGFTRLNVRVPNERDDASTTKVRVRFPAGFLFASYEPVAGWRVEIKKRKLDKPVEAYGEQIKEEVSEVVITARKGEGIRPGQFRDFGLSLGLPDRAGEKLTFKALQIYSSGEVVRWIGPEESDEPAPIVTLAEGEGHGGGSDPAAEPAAKPTEAAAGMSEDDDDGPSTGLVVAALVLGALGFLAGVLGLAAARRRRD